MGYVFTCVGGCVSQASFVQALSVSRAVLARFIKVGGYVIWHLHKTALPAVKAEIAKFRN